MVKKFTSHLTLQLYGTKEIWMDEHGVLYGNKWRIFYGPPDIVIGVSKRGGSNYGKVTSYILCKSHAFRGYLKMGY